MKNTTSLGVCAALCASLIASMPVAARMNVDAHAGSGSQVLSPLPPTPGPGSSVTRYVTTGADGGAGSLRAALAQSADSDVVVITPTLVPAITLTTGSLQITRTLITVQSAWVTTPITVQAQGAFRVFDVSTGASATLNALRILSGSASTGAGILNNGSLTVLNSIVARNTASTGGGGIYNAGVGTLVLSGTALISNTTTGNGGGVLDQGLLVTIQDSVLMSNTAARGGAFYSAGPLATVERSELSGNSASNVAADGAGGALYVALAGSLTVNQSTLSGNRAQSGGLGSAAFISGSLTLDAATVAANSGAAALYSARDEVHSLYVSNSVLSHTVGAPACSVASNSDLSIGGNLSTDGSCPFLGFSDDLTNTAALLAPLANNGGPAVAGGAMTPRTHALLPGSPALDVLDVAPYPIDQRGAPRPYGAKADRGAFEHSPLVAGYSGDNLGGSLRQAIADAFNGESVTFSPSVRGVITLTGGQIVIRSARAFSITGPGADLLAISAGGRDRLFNIDDAAAWISIMGLTLRDGNATTADGGPGHGGAVRNTGTAVLSELSIISNTSVAGGGAIHSTGWLTLAESTLSGNTASYGSAVSNADGSVFIRNSTLSGNRIITAPVGWEGGTIDQYATSVEFTPTISLLNSTVVSNTVYPSIVSRAGIWIEGGNLRMMNSIVASNMVTHNFAIESGAVVTSLGSNLSNSAIPSSVGSDRPLVNPLLGSLQNNGGRTLTHLPQGGSPARDNGNNTGCPALDQRGIVRPQRLRCDIGAVEIVSTPRATLPSISRP